jgi:ribosomal protein S21
MINAEVTKNDTESDVSLIRRFQKRVQGTGIVQRMRGRRYYSRAQSRTMRRKHTLKVLEKREVMRELIKLGKAVEPAPRRGGRR